METENTAMTFEQRVEDTFTRWLLDNRLHEKGEVTAPLADDFDARLRAAFADEELQRNLQTVRDLVEGLPLHVRMEQVQIREMRREYDALSKRDTERTFASYQIPKNEELRTKLGAFGLAEEETKRVLKANKTQREKLLGQYFDEKVDALVATYQRSTNTEQAANVIMEKIDTLTGILGNKYEQKAAIAKHRIYQIAEDREVVEYKVKSAPKYQILKARKRQTSYTPEVLEEAKLIGTIPPVIPEVLRNPTPLQTYKIKEPAYFKEPQEGFRIEDPVPTIGLLEYLASKPIETQVQEAPARSRFIEEQPRITVDDATLDRYLARQNETGFVLIGEPYIIQKVESPEVETQRPKAKRINPAQKFVNKIRARRAAKEAATQKAAVYEQLAAAPLYTSKLTELALVMPSSFYIPLPAIVMPEPTILREIRKREEATRTTEVAAFDELDADFFSNYNPETAEFTTTPVVIERIESNDVLENRVRRASRFSQIKGAITAVATVAAAVTALVGGIDYFAKISNDAVQAVYDSLKPETSIVETALEGYGKTLETQEARPAYAPEVPKGTRSTKEESQVYAPKQPARIYETGIEEQTGNIGVKAASQRYDDISVELPTINTTYTPIITTAIPIEIRRPEGTNGISSETTKEIVRLYEARQAATTQYTINIDPGDIAATKAKVDAFKEKRDNWESAKALLEQYDAILANPSAYQVE
ncbi:hypothetical protein HZC31_08600 [Candidatus Woesearchaeota archaeon]|nr:hypothetical protein [Candidatus Woesearchaeota archaeon]